MHCAEAKSQLRFVVQAARSVQNTTESAARRVTATSAPRFRTFIATLRAPLSVTATAPLLTAVLPFQLLHERETWRQRPPDPENAPEHPIERLASGGKIQQRELQDRLRQFRLLACAAAPYRFYSVPPGVANR